MTPLAIMKYIVERLAGTPYEPWVNALLFALFAAAVGAGVSLLLGARGRGVAAKIVMLIGVTLRDRKGYAPEWEAVRLRVEPYIDFGGYFYFAMVGLYSAGLVGTALALAASRVPVWVAVAAMVWVLGSFLYTRLNLELASWAYQRIKERRA